jgi:hypothetical protein
MIIQFVNSGEQKNLLISIPDELCLQDITQTHANNYVKMLILLLVWVMAMIHNLLYPLNLNISKKPYDMLKVNLSLLSNQCPGYVEYIILADTDPLFRNSKSGFII